MAHLVNLQTLPAPMDSGGMEIQQAVEDLGSTYVGLVVSSTSGRAAAASAPFLLSAAHL